MACANGRSGPRDATGGCLGVPGGDAGGTGTSLDEDGGDGWGLDETRLGGAHNMGITFNLAALKPMGAMAGMFGAPPAVAQALSNLPDSLTLSTAISFTDGNLHWRGDWPVKDVAKIAATVMAAQEGAKPEGDKDEEDY